MAKSKNEVMEAEDESHLNPPKDYTLRKGDRYVKFSAHSKNPDYINADLTNYYVSRGNMPTEEDTDGNPSPHLENETTWFNVEENKVLRYRGKDNDGNMIWEEDITAPRYVIELDGEQEGTLLGIIKNPSEEHKAKLHGLAKERIEELRPEVPSIQELMDEV